MKKYFEYKFDKQTGILYKYYYGNITFNGIESSWEYAFENNLIPTETKGFILDYTQATFNIKAEEHISIANFYKKNLQVFGNLRIAIIVENPKDIVVPILVETEDDGYESRPFSTKEVAIEWVLF